MINKVMPLDKLKCGNIFCVPHSLHWYMRTDTGYINLDNGEAVPEIDSQEWENVLLIYEWMGDMPVKYENDDFIYQTEWCGA